MEKNEIARCVSGYVIIMKVECSIRIEDRDCRQRSFNRFMNCNLYVGVLRKLYKSSIQDPLLYLRTANSTYRYQIMNNIECILGRNEKSSGKATIGFLTPKHYLMINCDEDKLVKLLRLLRKFSDREKVELSSVAIMKDLKKPTPKAKITNMPDPASVKEGVNLSPSFIIQFRQQYPCLWKAMQNLQKLELKDIENVRFPVILGQVPLVDVSLKNMGLRNHDLLWLNELQVRGSLRTFNLSHNKLTEFPTAVIDCLSLNSLDLMYNAIDYIPHGIHRLQKLRTLQMSHNKLRYLPADITLLQLENVDLAFNHLFSNVPLSIDETVGNFRGELRLEDWAALNVDTSSRLLLTARDCPNNLMRKLRSLSRCVCFRITPRSSSTEFYAPLGPVRFSASYCIHPQSGVSGEGHVFLQYHFCTYRNHCVDRKFKRENFFRLVKI